MPRRGRRVTVDGAAFQFLTVGGIARVHAELLPRLCDADPDLRIRLVTEGGLAHPLPAHERIRSVRLPDARRWLRPGRIWRGAVPRTAAAVRRLGFGSGRGAIWHSTHYTSPTTWRGPRVATVYDLIHEQHPEWFRRPHDDRHRAAKRRAVEEADALIAISEATAADLVDVFGPAVAERTTVVPLAAGPAFTPEVSGAPPHPRPYLLHVSRRVAHKGFDDLLRAYACWSGRREVDLVTVSQAWTDEERVRLDALGVADRVQRVGPLSDAGLADHYRHARALVHPSAVEGFGLPVLEALACGCPVVARPLPVTREIAGDLPVYADLGQVEDAHRAFDEAVGLGPRDRRRSGGPERAAGYSWEGAAAATVAVYRRLLP